MTRSRSTCASPKLRSPGVSMTQPPPGQLERDRRRRRVPAAAGDEVHAARRPVRAGHQGVDHRRLADAGVADHDAHAVPQVARQLVERLVTAHHHVVDVEGAVGLEDLVRGCQVGLRQAEQRPQAGVVGRDEAAVDQAQPRGGVGEGGDHDQLVGVGDDHALDRVGVVRRAPQRRRARLHPDDAGQGVRRPGHVPDERDAVADDDAAPAQLAGLHRHDFALVDAAGAPAPVDRDDDADDRVVVRGSLLAARSRPSRRPHPYVVLVQLAPPARRAHAGARPASIASHRFTKPGRVLAVVATSSTSTPGTHSPITAAVVASRWSS